MDIIKTRHDTDISDMVNYQILSNVKELNFFHLLQSDIDLLLEYSPKLFNTLSNDKDLYQVLIKFVKLVNECRLVAMWDNKEKHRVKQYSHRKNQIKIKKMH